MSTILIVDDQRCIRNSLDELIHIIDPKHTTLKAESAAEAIKLIEKHHIDLCVCDIMMPQMNGDELLHEILQKHPEMPVIMISGHGTIETAVRCIHEGAVDFIEKPLDMNRVVSAVRGALERGKLIVENKSLKKKLHKSKGVDIIGQSDAIRGVLGIVERAAESNSRVLITGSNGTGKELVARQLHLKSNRADSPFVEVNCAAIPSELIESELFGHEKGSFTSAHKQRKGKFELAEGGTIFLDEIGDMSLSAQAKVLRALQENKISRVGGDSDIQVDVRVISATNKDLRKEIDEGRFREDLFHRISTIRIHVPDLKDRSDDIPAIVEHFLKIVCNEQSRSDVSTISPDALEYMQQLPWSGNVRELRNCVERLVILSRDPASITLADVKTHC